MLKVIQYDIFFETSDEFWSNSFSKSVSRWRKGQKSSAVTLVEIQSDPIELKIQIMEPTSLEKEKNVKICVSSSNSQTALQNETASMNVGAVTTGPWHFG